MELTPVTRISGRVLDDETGEGIPGAVVGLKKGFIRNDLKAVELVGDNRTDHEGRFSFEDLRVSTLEYNVFALHPDYKEGFVKTRPVEDPIEIRLNRAGFRIHGHARDDSGKPIEGLIISFHSEFHPEERNVLTDSKGNYTSPPLPEGTIRASAGSAYGYTFPCFTPECKWIELRDRDVEVNFGPSGQLAVWQGYLIGWDGQPLKHVYINMDSQTFFKDYPFKRSSHSASSDDKGFFEIPKIPLGKFIVKLHIYSSVSFYYLSDSHDGLTDTVEFPNPVIHIQDFCLPHTEISGCVIDGRTNEPLRSAEVIARKCDVKGNGLYITYTDVNGYYSFHGLPPGKYMMDAGIRVGRRAFFIYELWSNFKLELEEDKFLSNQDIILPASSKVTVTVIGLAKGMKYNVEFFYENEQEACWDSWIYGHSEAFCKDRYDIFHNMAPGHWIMKIWSPDEKVLAEKRFVVHQDQEMDIELDLN
ncbi:MAG: hypothetical protein ACYTG7_12955 [Planctomycetota bacterium]|jgi:hypothetical protein